jgi:hypothetical protein
LCSLSEENDDKPYGGFLKLGYPQIIHFSRIFHYKPSSNWGTSIYGNPHMDLGFWGMQISKKAIVAECFDFVGRFAGKTEGNGPCSEICVVMFLPMGHMSLSLEVS